MKIKIKQVYEVDVDFPLYIKIYDIVEDSYWDYYKIEEREHEDGYFNVTAITKTYKWDNPPSKIYKIQMSVVSSLDSYTDCFDKDGVKNEYKLTESEFKDVFEEIKKLEV